MADIHIPDPAYYGISPKYGFLSPDAPSTAFQDAYYQPWDDIASHLNKLISDTDLKDAVDKLPVLSTDRLSSDLEYRRAYVVLGFTVHAYIWHQTPPNPFVPAELAEPFFNVCEHLRMEPVLSYAGLCTWNWKIRNGGGMTLENLDTLASFTGTRGEAAFYHVPVLVEAEGGHLIHLLLDALAAGQQGRFGTVTDALKETASALIRMGAHLSQFYGVLQPKFFYHDLRPFLAGGNGMEEKGLPNGMMFESKDGSKRSLKLVGGSAAQSSLYPFLDAVLGVEHEDRTVFEEMRAYMPGLHQDFLEEVSRLPSLRSFIKTQPENIQLVEAYNECLQQLKSWRGKHIAIVSKYIVQPAREAARAGHVDKLETDGPPGTEKEWELQGTGGSALIPFLRQAKDDTKGIS